MLESNLISKFGLLNMNRDFLNKIEKSYPVYKIEGNEKLKTIYFKIGKREILPGQFFMLNYNLSQKPFSVSYILFGKIESE